VINIFIGIIILITTPLSVTAGGARPDVTQAQQAFEQGDYARAISLYESIITAYGATAAGYYNLGNCYYRNRQPGHAIVSYERALRLSPRDGDIRYNLDFVREQLKQPDRPLSEIITGAITSYATINELSVATSFLFIIMSCALAAFMLSRRRFLILAGAGLVVLTAGSAAWLGLTIRNRQLTSWGVVISGPADVRNGPGMENSVGFTLPEGRKIIVLSEKDEWAAIGLAAEGLKGWVEKKYIDKI